LSKKRERYKSQAAGLESVRSQKRGGFVAMQIPHAERILQFI